MISEKKVIFIIGRGRSGTTLLNKVLSAHPKIGFISNEVNYLYWFWQKQNYYEKYGSEKYWRMALDFSKSHGVAYRQVEVTKDKFMEIDCFRQWYFAILECYCPGKEYFGIKIADYIIENIEMIISEFNDSYCIHIIRDPRDIYLSVKKMPRNNSPYYCAKYWKEVMEATSRLKNSILNYFEIRYESLITEPERETKAICEWLKLDFSDRMMNFHQYVGNEHLPAHKLLWQTFVPENFNKWKKELREDEISLIYAACADKMLELGYLDQKIESNISLLRRIREYAYSKASSYYGLFKFRKIFSFRMRNFKLGVYLKSNYYYWSNRIKHHQ